MINTLRIKKRYIYFFVISFFLTFGLVSLLNSFSLKKINSIQANCSKHTINVDYRYLSLKNKSNESKIHNVIMNLLSDELLVIMKSNKNYYFNGEKIVFLDTNCEKRSKELVAKKKIIENNIRLDLLNLDKYFFSDSVRLEIEDYYIITYLNSKEAYIDFSIDTIKTNNNSTVKNIIRFLIIIFLLNLIFHLVISIKIKID